MGAIKSRDELKGFELNFARDLASVKCRMMIDCEFDIWNKFDQ